MSTAVGPNAGSVTGVEGSGKVESEEGTDSGKQKETLFLEGVMSLVQTRREDFLERGLCGTHTGETGGDRIGPDKAEEKQSTTVLESAGVDAVFVFR